MDETPLKWLPASVRPTLVVVPGQATPMPLIAAQAGLPGGRSVTLGPAFAGDEGFPPLPILQRHLLWARRFREDDGV